MAPTNGSALHSRINTVDWLLFVGKCTKMVAPGVATISPMRGPEIYPDGRSQGVMPNSIYRINTSCTPSLLSTLGLQLSTARIVLPTDGL